MVIQEVGLIQVPNRKIWLLQRLYCFLENILLKFQLCIGHSVLKMYYSTVIQARGNLLITLLLVCTGPNDPSVVRNNILNKYAISRFIFLFIIVLCITITTHQSFELMILNFFIPGFKNSNGQIQSVLVSLQFKTLVQNCLQLS